MAGFSKLTHQIVIIITMSSTAASKSNANNNRNRNSGGGGGGQGGGGGSRRGNGRRRSRGGRDRDRRDSRPENQAPAPVKEPTFTEKLLSILSFGLIKPKSAAKPGGNQSRGNRPGGERTPNPNRDRDREGGPRERGERGERGERNRDRNRGDRERGGGERLERPDRGDRPERGERRDRGERGERPDRGERGDRGGEQRERRREQMPEQAPVTTERLYVGNLNYDAAESDLYDLFSGVGKVRNAEVVCHRYTQRSKGYAFVEMSSVDEAKRAVDVLHDKDFMGRKLWISGAKSEGPKGEDASDEDEAPSGSASESAPAPQAQVEAPAAPVAAATPEEPSQPQS